MREYLIEFTERLGFSEKARGELLFAYGAVLSAPSAERILLKALADYEKATPTAWHWSRTERALDGIADLISVPSETLKLLFCILLTPTLRRRYRESGYEDPLFDDAVLDLRWKALECERMRGFTGVFCFDFLHPLFALERFTLGRLQFRLETADRTISTESIHLAPGDAYLNMRIPSSGPLERALLADSYGRAIEFFRERLKRKPTVIQCTSWLLFPRHRELLSPDSNIRRFAEDFELYDSGESREGEDLWRIFYKNAKNPPDQLPRSTTLERVYADLLMRGEFPGWGSGVLLAERFKA